MQVKTGASFEQRTLRDRYLDFLSNTVHKIRPYNYKDRRHFHFYMHLLPSTLYTPPRSRLSVNFAVDGSSTWNGNGGSGGCCKAIAGLIPYFMCHDHRRTLNGSDLYQGAAISPASTRSLCSSEKVRPSKFPWPIF